MVWLMVVFSGLAALLSAFIWYLEAFSWDKQATKVFGHTAKEAQSTKEIAFNLGFYNLFLGLITAIGLVLFFFIKPAGVALIGAGLGSMLSASLLLFFTSPDKRSAAVKQGFLPLLGLIFLFLV